jgi:hypothetical protein
MPVLPIEGLMLSNAGSVKCTDTPIQLGVVACWGQGPQRGLQVVHVRHELLAVLFRAAATASESLIRHFFSGWAPIQ